MTTKKYTHTKQDLTKENDCHSKLPFWEIPGKTCTPKYSINQLSKVPMNDLDWAYEV